MKTSLLICISGFLAFAMTAQNVLTFQPSGGLNDGSDEGTINAGKDTWTNRYNSTTNDGANIYAAGSARSNCNMSDYKAYYQFDLGTLPATVDSVFFGVLHTPHTANCYSNCTANFYFYYVTAPWNEMTLTQQNEPTEDTSSFYGPIPISFPNDYQIQEYNITSAYNAWKTGALPNYGFTVYSPNVGCNNAAVTFGTHTSDDTSAAARPYLKVYYPSQANITEEGLALHAYPNPFTDHIQLNIERFNHYYFTDLTGRQLDLKYDAHSKRFNTSMLHSGIYFLYVESGQNRKTIKLIKR